MIRIALLCSIAFLSLPAHADTAEESGWEHARTEAGVEVYTRDVPGSVFKEFRATGVVPASLELVVGWWRDPGTFTSWIDSCAEARPVDAGEGIRASYLQFDFPFPASDRDVVLRAVDVESSADRVVVESVDVDGVVPEVDGLVRIAMMRGRWEFTREGPDETRVVYRQHMDAGGNLPGFILNRAAIDNPIGTLSGLARFAGQEAAR